MTLPSDISSSIFSWTACGMELESPGRIGSVGQVTVVTSSWQLNWISRCSSNRHSVKINETRNNTRHVYNIGTIRPCVTDWWGASLLVKHTRLTRDWQLMLKIILKFDNPLERAGSIFIALRTLRTLIRLHTAFLRSYSVICNAGLLQSQYLEVISYKISL